MKKVFDPGGIRDKIKQITAEKFLDYVFIVSKDMKRM